ncbi:YgiW/YdeI family stress tolerance OB fold protein [Vibrio paucivorans]|uniref:NirD/YgiW/YdeI family stress tolerance protein n=1 Tax=Vibrio paucivorans TaxID=2829489 RepID=A0A9X3CID6_9VIBR|nr:NirD/YgiW/YdeI family stress tolerance protein [Vibrio paucivorans]MCW8336379.1 NirD/YgiW/YdeI family stress tolerance protein [Vibrio paucivorans]
MKTFITISTLGLVLAASGSAFAAFNDGNASQGASTLGGFNGPTQGMINTVQAALESSDDTPVTLTGHIVKALGKKDYLFKDDTGEITVEISHKRWQGQEITPSDTVQIVGEVDKDWSERDIDVDTIRKL